MARAIQRGWRRPRLLNRVLYPLSLVYAAAMAARADAYRGGVFARHKLPAPLIVVGNLCAGGTGKTPLVMALAEALHARGLRPGIITRGYKARPGRPGRPDSWPREARVDADPAEVGDEAALLARRCRAPVFAGPNRRRAAQALLAAHACDILISDDGFQHLQLRRDLDIVVVDARRRFGNGWHLPAGPLRESPAALARADIVVANCGDGGDGAGDARPGEFRMQTRIDHAVQLVPCGDGAGAEKPLREFAGPGGRAGRVHAVAGIGHPARFFRQLRAAGVDAVAHEFPDHHRFTAADFAFAAAGDTVLMTEKDAVKCRALVAAGKLPGEYWTVPLRVELPGEFFAAVFAHLARAGVAVDGP